MTSFRVDLISGLSENISLFISRMEVSLGR